jgi:hypothetical protein
VSIRLTIFRLLSILAIVGLIAAPVVRPASAATAMMHAQIADTSTTSNSDGMAEAMPCCPEKAPVSGCHDCPLMAVCHGVSLLSQSEISLIVFSISARSVPVLNEAVLSGLGQGPPHRPPKV